MSAPQWYFYNGRIPVPVRVEGGGTVAVRPRSKVFAAPDAVERYGSSFRRCARPAGLVPAFVPVDASVSATVDETGFASSTTETVTTRDPQSLPAPRRVSAPETTEDSPASGRENVTEAATGSGASPGVSDSKAPMAADPEAPKKIRRGTRAKEPESE